jgi:hypothetical protein
VGQGEERAVDDAGFVVAAYLVTATLVSLYTWRLARRLREARRAVDGMTQGARWS